MGRKRIYTDEERIQRRRENSRKWREKQKLEHPKVRKIPKTRKEIRDKHYLKHREEIILKKREFRRKNSKRIKYTIEEKKQRKKLQRKLYKQKHPNKIREAKRRYRKKHPDKIREAKRRSYKKYPEKYRASSLKYHYKLKRENPQKLKDNGQKFRISHPGYLYTYRETYRWQKQLQKAISIIQSINLNNFTQQAI